MKKLLLLIFLFSASSQLFGDDEDDLKKAKVDEKRRESLELKMAKLWGRFDELEIKVKKQSERIKLLEKGLMLGVIPKELLEDKLSLNTKDPEPLDWDQGPSRLAGRPEKESPRKNNYNEELQYSELLNQAQQAFSSGAYGQAIAFYQRIENSYSEKVEEGQTKYWIGLSWYYLKEYEQSEESFKKLVENFPSSPWVPKSKFYLAKISIQQGLPKLALDQLNEVINSYPNSDTSEMAVYELKLLKERL